MEKTRLDYLIDFLSLLIEANEQSVDGVKYAADVTSTIAAIRSTLGV